MAGSSNCIDATALTTLLLKPTTVEEDTVYYTKLCNELGGKVEVGRHPIPEKGRGLFATSAISQGDTIFIEKPLISMQDINSKADILACAQCLRPAGGFEHQILWYLLTKDDLTKDEEMLKRQLEDREIELPRLENLEMPESSRDLCWIIDSKSVKNKRWINGIVYFVLNLLECMPCLMEIGEWVRPGASVDREALDAFEDFCEETNHSFYLVAKAFSRCLTQAIQSINTNNTPPTDALQIAWKPFQHSWRPSWRDCVPVPEDVDDVEFFYSELEDLLLDASSTLDSAINTPTFDGIINTEMFGGVMGMIEQNNIAILVPSPLELYIDRLNAADDALVSSLWDHYPALKDSITHAAQFQLRGAGYYSVACCANHSCQPNAISISQPDITVDHALVLVADRDIRQGEEITVSYIDENAPLNVRCEQLRDYGFVCDCVKCTAERLQTTRL